MKKEFNVYSVNMFLEKYISYSAAIKGNDWKQSQKYLQQISLFSLQEAVGMV